MVIAMGDFYHGDRFEYGHLLLCRELRPSTKLYRIENDSGSEYMLDEIDGARQMLSACPRESIIDFDCQDDDEAL